MVVFDINLVGACSILTHLPAVRTVLGAGVERSRPGRFARRRRATWRTHSRTLQKIISIILVPDVVDKGSSPGRQHAPRMIAPLP
jgi:hypothetical protein